MYARIRLGGFFLREILHVYIDLLENTTRKMFSRIKACSLFRCDKIKYLIKSYDKS